MNFVITFPTKNRHRYQHRRKTPSITGYQNIGVYILSNYPLKSNPSIRTRPANDARRTWIVLCQLSTCKTTYQTMPKAHIHTPNEHIRSDKHRSCQTSWFIRGQGRGTSAWQHRWGYMDAVWLVVFPTHLTTARVYYVPRSGKLIQLPTCGEGTLPPLFSYSFSVCGKRRKILRKRAAPLTLCRIGALTLFVLWICFFYNILIKVKVIEWKYFFLLVFYVIYLRLFSRLKLISYGKGFFELLVLCKELKNLLCFTNDNNTIIAIN